MALETLNLNSRLSSLGVALLAGAGAPADPERTLLACIPLFQEDRKLLSLVCAWLDEFEDLVHVERLCALIDECSPEAIAWLGGLASRMSGKDQRWNEAVQAVETRTNCRETATSENPLDLLQAERKGRDPDFAQFGITIPVFEAADGKKLRPREYVLSQHPWLRIRSVLGANWQADVAMAKYISSNRSTGGIAAFLGCDEDTVERYLTSLEKVNIEALLSKPFC